MGIGVNIGLTIGLGGAGVASPPATLDATSGIYVPQTAAEWIALGFASPRNLHLLQEAGGDALDAIGAAPLTPNNAPARQIAVAGWSAKAVGAPAGAGVGTLSGASGVNVNAVSTMQLIYALTFDTGVAQAALSPSDIGGNGPVMKTAGGGLLRLDAGGNLAQGVLNHAGVVRPYVLQFNRTGSLTGVYSDIEKVQPAFTTVGIAGDIITLQFGLISPLENTRILYHALWSGADAEISATAIKAMLTALLWSPSWTP